MLSVKRLHQIGGPIGAASIEPSRERQSAIIGFWPSNG